LAAGLPPVVSAKTLVLEHADGTEDFDLDLRVDASALASGQQFDTRAMMGKLLRRTEMPRTIRIEPANEMDGNCYK
jgi:hypothetical protein